MIQQPENLINNSTAIASLIVGILGFISAIGTLLYNSQNNKRHYRLLLEKNEREKTKSYNRILGNFLKVYHSYIKHKYLFQEAGIEKLPDKVLLKLIDKTDKFEAEINRFRMIVDNESEIIPEITIQLYELLDLLDRFQLMSEELDSEELIEGQKNKKLVAKRAHIYSVKKLLDEYFIDLINDLSKEANISGDFQQKLNKFNSEEFFEKNLELQNELADRMLESLSRQLERKVSYNELLY